MQYVAIQGNPLSNGPKVLFTAFVGPHTLFSEACSPVTGANKTGVRDRQLVTYVFAPPITSPQTVVYQQSKALGDEGLPNVF